MKKYCAEVSFTGRCYVYVDAENKKEAQVKVFDGVDLDLVPEPGIEVEMDEWGFIFRQRGGFIQEPGISDMEIYEIHEESEAETDGD